MVANIVKFLRRSVFSNNLLHRVLREAKGPKEVKGVLIPGLQLQRERNNHGRERLDDIDEDTDQ